MPSHTPIPMFLCLEPITVNFKNMKNKRSAVHPRPGNHRELEAQLCLLLGNVINLPEPQFLSLEMVVSILPCRPVVRIILRIDETLGID